MWPQGEYNVSDCGPHKYQGICNINYPSEQVLHSRQDSLQYFQSRLLKWCNIYRAGSRPSDSGVSMPDEICKTVKTSSIPRFRRRLYRLQTGLSLSSLYRYSRLVRQEILTVLIPGVRSIIPLDELSLFIFT